MSSLQQAVQRARECGDIAPLLEVIPYARLIGVSRRTDGVFCLAAKRSNLGNPKMQAVHGGAMAGFMEMSAVLHLLMGMETLRFPKVIDFAIDYLRPAFMVDTFAECELVREGRKLINVRVLAWQGDQRQLVASARANFLLSD